VYDVLWGICSYPQLQRFQLYHTISSVGNPAFASIAYALNYSKTLQQLVLNVRTMDVDAGNMLARGLARSTTLEVFDLSGSTMTSSAVGSFSFGLRLNQSIQTLKFDGCRMDDEDTAKILRALQDHPKLKILSISQNQCHDEGMAAIASLLHYHSELEELDMSYLIRKPRKPTTTTTTPTDPPVEDSTAETSTTTTEEGQENNDQEGGGTTTATTVTEENQEETKEQSSEEMVEEQKQQDEEQQSQRVSNTHLRKFAMAGNYLSDGFLESLLGVFGPQSTLEELYLFGNRITDYGLGLIVTKIPQWKHLRSLWLGQNLFTAEVVEKLLVNRMKTNYTIMEVNVRSFDDQQVNALQDTLDHYCRLNQGGRRIFAPTRSHMSSSTSTSSSSSSSSLSVVPLSLWPLILERTQRVFPAENQEMVNQQQRQQHEDDEEDHHDDNDNDDDDDSGSMSTTAMTSSRTTIVHPYAVDALYCLLIQGPAIFDNPHIMG